MAYCGHRTIKHQHPTAHTADPPHFEQRVSKATRHIKHVLIFGSLGSRWEWRNAAATDRVEGSSWSLTVITSLYRLQHPVFFRASPGSNTEFLRTGIRIYPAYWNQDLTFTCTNKKNRDNKNIQSVSVRRLSTKKVVLPRQNYLKIQWWNIVWNCDFWLLWLQNMIDFLQNWRTQFRIFSKSTNINDVYSYTANSYNSNS